MRFKFSFKNDASVNEQDRDGGGTLDRTEVAVGLFKMGIWLSPPEVRLLNPILPDKCMHIFQSYRAYVYVYLSVLQWVAAIKKPEI
jgi:hypothetical protein